LKRTGDLSEQQMSIIRDRDTKRRGGGEKGER